jgi:hypothetical protein
MDLLGSLRRLARAVFTIDLRSLALFRVALSLVILIDLALRARLLTTNYTDAGAYPRSVLADYHEAGTLPSLHLAFGSFEAQVVLFTVAALAALLLGLGWRTRLATVVCWLLLDSLQQRNRLVLLGGDAMLHLILFWSIFLPLGARASLDSLRRRTPVGTSVCSPASAALLLQVGCIYLATGLLKTGPKWTQDGTAIYYALNRTWQVRPFGEWLLAHYPLTEWLTLAVLWFERLGPLLLFVPVATAPLRLLLIPGFWALMAGLGLGLRLHIFPWVGSIALLPFLPALAWDAIGRGASAARPDPSPVARRGWRRIAHGLTHAMVLFLLLLVLWINAGTLSESLAPPPKWVRIAGLLHLKQNWSMYAPEPKPYEVRLEHRGRLRSGSMIDLDSGHIGAGWTSVLEAWDDFRFENSLVKLAGPRRQKGLDSYALWLCRQWNQDRRGNGRLDWVAVDRIWRNVPAPGEPESEPEVLQVAGVPCPG